MDADRNPFAPAAGAPPPVLAGRESVLIDVTHALARVTAAQPARSQLLAGPRGVGKTALLHEIARIASVEGIQVIRVEAAAHARLAELLVAPLRRSLSSLADVAPVRPAVANALRALHAFTNTFVSSPDRPRTTQRRPRRTGRGDLRTAFPELMATVAHVARSAGTAVALLVDEVHFLAPECLGALVQAVQLADQRGLPLIVFATGLSSQGSMDRETRSLVERFFMPRLLGPLAPEAAVRAIEEPIRHAGADIEPAAVAAIVRDSTGYPYFLQCWGWHVWNLGAGSPFTAADVAHAAAGVGAALDREFFAAGLESLAPPDRAYLRAMAQLGPGPHRSGDIAAALGIPVTGAAHRRSVLIRKGLLYSPQRGATAFAAPGLDAYLRRTMPHWPPARDGRPS